MRNTLKPTSAMITEIQKHAIKAFPHEACGVIVKKGKSKMQVVSCRNIAEVPEHFFVCHPDDLAAAEEQGEFVAVWHSHTHTDNTASDADMAGCEATELPWLIIALRQADEAIEGVNWHVSDLNVITPSGFEMPYLERPYVFGVFDCWLLCRDYLKREFNVHLDVLPELHIPRWWEGDVDILGDNYKDQGLVRLEEGTEPQKGDIFFMQFGGKFANHCAVYIGDDMILHHQQDRLSCRAIYGGSFAKHTTHHLRHKDLM